MLAEARRRKKWSVDPRNSTWSNDDQRYGVKMLEKMGWNKGKGLGINEDGDTSHVKVSHKADSRGLGCSLSYENNWVAHQDDFSTLLNQLNSDHDKPQESRTKSDIAVANLETQSRSQKVLHYQKFSKGKNLTLYKQEDISAIFGTSIKTATTTDCVDRSIKKKFVEIGCTKRVPKDKIKNKTETKDFTVVSEFNIQEYFQMRKAEMLSSKSESVSKKKQMSCETSPFGSDMAGENQGVDKKSHEQKIKTNKKKKKKRKKLIQEPSNCSISHKKRRKNTDDIS